MNSTQFYSILSPLRDLYAKEWNDSRRANNNSKFAGTMMDIRNALKERDNMNMWNKIRK